ncbi:ddt domain protein [Diplodia corticola]|uniref:Ddt domain protein n=1 Tax=Diplodia corticola TaxID=236234 RepID=A0A1J9R7M5_9PEZI|nr:ddt domain protein [Diplodia corticola]OJD36202.1 ddt domain protein [Diplodia corticola]
MVFYKRAPVPSVPDPNIRDENTTVWMIKATGEIFTEYDKYTNRLDFYRKKQFTNQITGQGNLSFFDALEAEDEDAREIRSIFPGPLRFQVCRKVHHSTIPRLEELVTRVHADLKDDYYPGEHVIAQIDESADKRQPGVIRDKITFSPSVDIRSHPTLHQPPLSRYFVTVQHEDGQSNDMLLDSKRLSRDRRTYSRSILRSFIRNIAHSENYKGAPWQVKPELVQQFKLPEKVPYALTAQGIAEAKRNVMKNENTTFFNYYRGPGNELQRQPPQTVAFQQTMFPPPPPATGVFRPGPGVPAPPPFQQPLGPNGTPPIPMNGQYGPPQHQITIPSRPPPAHAPPRPAPIKYPIEDLLIQPKRNGLQRPALKFLSDDVPEGAEPPAEPLGIEMKSVGDLLFVWQTLNVHAEVFILDSFTVDDFIEALGYHGDATGCELLVEMHCAVLKQLVDEKGHIKVLSDLASEFSQDIEPEEEEEEEEAEEDTKSPTPARSETPPARRTRASLSKLQAQELAEPEPEKEAAPEKTNRASELLSQFDWIDHLARRSFMDGGWQSILVGALRQASLNPRRKEVCEKILAHLVPSDLDPDPETVALQYNTLDINFRIAILGIITQYATFTDAVRTYMQTCNVNMTAIRNQKMEQQKKRKEYQADLAQLEQKRKMDYPATLSVSPPAETNGDVSMSGVTEPDTHAEHEGGEDEEGARRLRRANSRKRKHEDETTRKERERKEKEEAERAKQRNAYRELLKKIDKTNDAIRTCEAEIKKFDEELRENQCQQLRCLGKDRFCNTYWWLERWGMPLGGLPTSSTAEYGYVNGRLWIQGPDPLDKPLLEHENSEDEREYKALTGMSKKERRDVEEGPVHLTDSMQWGYIDNPEDVQKIHEWLDDRGHRELKLKKELGMWQDSIIEYMVNWKNHLSEVQAQKTAGEDTTGIQTRKKTYTENDSSKYWCLKWENSYALDHLEHLHSQQPPPKTKAKNSRAKKGAR